MPPNKFQKKPNMKKSRIKQLFCFHIYKDNTQTHKSVCLDKGLPFMRLKQTCDKCGKVKYTPLTLPMSYEFVSSFDINWI